MLGSLILIGGSLGDVYGEKRVFTLGVAGFGLASILCAAAPTIESLVAGRALQGAFGALLTPASLAIIVNAFDGSERGAAIGAWTAYSGIAAIVGPLAGGWLVDTLDWRLDLRDQRPVRRGDADPHRADAGAPAHGRGPAAGLGRRRAVRHRARGPDVRAHPAAAVGLERPAHRGGDRRRPRGLRRLPRVGAARARPDAPARPLQARQLRVGQRRDVRDVRRASASSSSCSCCSCSRSPATARSRRAWRRCR